MISAHRSRPTGQRPRPRVLMPGPPPDAQPASQGYEAGCFPDDASRVAAFLFLFCVILRRPRVIIILPKLDGRRLPASQRARVVVA
jgi:hypothetical protein